MNATSDDSKKAPEAKAGAKGGGYHHGDLRNALLAAAETLLADQDAESLSLRAVAREAGVSAAAPYHHFADKEALLAALAADGFRRAEAEMRAEAARYATPRDRLAGLGVAYVRWARAHRGVHQVMLGKARYLSASTPELTEAATRAYQLLVDSVAALGGAQSGDPALADLVATAAWSIVHGLASLMADGAVMEPEGVDADAYVFQVLRRGMPAVMGDDPGPVEQGPVAPT